MADAHAESKPSQRGASKEFTFLSFVWRFFLAAAAIGTLVWLLIDFGILAAGSASALTWTVLVCLATLLSIGLSWSHVWRRLTGQFNVDDAD